MTSSVTVYTPDGQVIGDDSTTRDDDEVRRALGGEGVTVVDDSGGRVLLPVVTPDGTTVIRASVTEEVLRAGVNRAWASIIGLGIALMAIAALIASQLGRRISEPLHAVAAVAHRLREGDLSARAEIEGTEETEELARALNGLAERTRELLVAERGAVADLSHRLRTPVTALRLDAETVTDTEVARRLGEHIGVLQRSIDAIVRDARRPVRENLREICNASAVVSERVAFWRALAEDQGRPVRGRRPRGSRGRAAGGRRSRGRRRRPGRQRLRAHAGAGGLRGPAGPLRRQGPARGLRRGDRARAAYAGNARAARGSAWTSPGALPQRPAGR